MYELYIYVVPDPLAQLPPFEKKAQYEFETSEQAELRALLYLSYCPNDIVMLVEFETGECKHCDRPIRENAGWLIHKWVHENGAYLCWSNEHTQAEPKEDMRANT